ncbi:GNAT family N-acetyltransferase [Paenibacillus sp. UNC499MF]|uniref:GNAT family N-acetyltransferase n=1 Tax=Paenibacillus sp. UNC499MF TaxID=1502751 RepID=UPI0008A06E1F|nr:GNAT family N-acetyltransferase [Paenibacillus sp. UNC499MF]SEG42992.1 N-acetylglutamate synthase, GNAT family [Paenibacillus sp. UNC499MF]
MNEQAAIRLIRHDELDQLLELYRQLNTEDPVIPPSEELDRQWSDMFHDPGMKFVVAEDQGKLAAVCVLVIVRNLTRGGRPFGLIENVVTSENHRKKGYGSLILQKALDLARVADCYKVMLLTSSKEDATLRFYEKNGFEKDVKTGFISYLWE